MFNTTEGILYSNLMMCRVFDAVHEKEGSKLPLTTARNYACFCMQIKIGYHKPMTTTLEINNGAMVKNSRPFVMLQ